MGILHIQTFIIAVIVFALTPGIDTLFILNRSLTQGRKAGIYSTLGILSGVLVHLSLAGLGLSLILAKSAVAFSFVKYIGAAYLIYLGVSKLISKNKIALIGSANHKSETMLKMYTSGIITNVFNPKVALFFLAFFLSLLRPNMPATPCPFSRWA